MTPVTTEVAGGDVSAVAQAAADAALATIAPSKPAASPTNAELPTDTSAPVETDEALETEEITDDQPDDDAEETEVNAITLPDGLVVVEPVAENLVTDFTLRDASGEELEVPALMIEYKANGKIRTDRLDQVVKLAQFGVYNQEREQKVQSVEQEMRNVAQQREELAEMLAEREAQMERLLTDEDFYLTVQEKYGKENSPELRAQRAEEQLRNFHVQQELQQISATGEQFLNSELEPALQLIEQALPTVTRDELDERLTYAMQAHLVQGPGGVPYLPESRYAAVRRYIVEDLARWAQMVHHDRTEATRDPVKERLAAERDRARIESQKAKRQVGQTLKSVTRAVGSKPERTKSRPIASVDDAVDSALSTVLSSLR